MDEAKSYSLDIILISKAELERVTSNRKLLIRNLDIDYPDKCPHCQGPAYINLMNQVDCYADCNG